MANTFINLPAPAANGAGAWVDTSSMGALRSVTSVGNGGVFEPFVTIEFSNNSSPADGVPLETFFQPGEATFVVAAMWMRAVVSNYRGGGAPTVNVGSTTDGCSADHLVATAGSGTGAGVDTSALPPYKTIQVEGVFRGQVNILISQDGGATYNEAFSFQSPGGQTALFAADFMKVERVGVPSNTPGLPAIWVAATNPPGGGGGGGGGSLTVTDGVTTVTNVVEIFVDPALGMGVQDLGGDVAQIGYAQDVVEQDGTAVVDGTRILNFIGATITADTDPGSDPPDQVRANISYAGVLPKTARYTVTGDEPSLSDFTINLTSLGIPQPNANYNSFVNLGGVTNGVYVDVPQVDNAPTTIHVVGGPFTAGDVLTILIVPFVPV